MMRRPFLILCLAGLFVGRAEAAGLGSLSEGDLVISEILPDPSAVAYYRGQWFEVYNNSGASVDLDGLKVTDGGSESFTVSGTLTVADGDYAVFAVRDNSSVNGGIPSVDYVFSIGDFSLTSGGDTITLEYDGTTFDSVTYDSATYPDPYGASLSLSPLSLDSTSNDTGSNWCEPYSTYGDGDYGTPGSANDDCPSSLSSLSGGDLIISEVLQEPLSSDYNKGEWFEIYNASSTYVDLDGLVVDGGGSEQIVVSGELPLRPGEYAVFAARDVSSQNGGLPQVDYRYIYGSELTLTNTDSLELSYGATIFDEVSWSTLSFPIDTGVSMELGTNDYDSVSNDSGSTWCEALTTYGDGDYGSPGSENGDCDTDTDGDGYDEDVDCDDNDGSINPGADEVCDDVDNDCDDEIDEDPTDGTTYYADTDGDFYGDPAVTVDACERPTDYRTNNLDCDDTSASINPGETETCDGTDNNCSGDETDASDTTTYYADTDTDGYGDSASTTDACSQPSGYVADSTDCDDGASDVNPGESETCDGTDNNCSGDESDASDVNTYYADTDSDFYGDPASTVDACERPTGYRTNNLDCDDTSASVNPGESETCDGTDNNCSGDETDASDTTTWYADTDTDGYGDSASTTDACTQPTGYVADETDCDDGASDVNPGESETCDGTDNNCSGDESDASDVTTYYADTDYDFYGDPASTVDACERPTGYRTNNLDCDDTSASINPGESETCDGTDNNCSGDETDASDATTWYADTDSDTYGDSASTTDACTQPSGYVADSTDCDDTSASINPGESETCDGTDNNCSGDESDASDVNTYYADSDYDFYGDPASTVDACERPTGYRTNNLDCDDTSADVNPGEVETCDGTDNNCTGDETDASDAVTYYADTDTDGYGDSEVSAPACSQPSGYVADSTDCDDGASDVNPGESETCDGTDNNCSGDETDASDATTWYVDSDGDTYGDLGSSTVECAQPSGYVADSTDCDDGAAGVNPGESETCDGTDNNCSGDESDASDAVTYYADTDGDGYGDAGSTQEGCSVPSGYAADSTDCDDSSASVNPGESEICNDGSDSDCDGYDSASVCEADLGGANAVFYGVDAADRAGYSVDGGDINGDGYSDVVIGARLTDDAATDAGSTYVYFGPLSGSNGLSGADGKLNGESGGDYSGVTIAAGGDVNNDGYDDVLIGAKNEDQGDTDAGAAYLVLGPYSGTSGLASAADAKLYGTGSGDYAGNALAHVGDVDNDGYDDFMVGAESNDDAYLNGGSAYLLLGPVSSDDSLSSAADTVFTGAGEQDFAGYWVAGGGDFDSDGHADILINAYRVDIVVEGNTIHNVGATYVFHGPVTSGTISVSSADATITGATANDQAGQNAIASAGDTNNDGYDDIIIGAQYADDGGTSSGAAYLFFGPVSGDLSTGSADATFAGESASDFAGRSVDGAGDIDGDSHGDVLIGAKKNDYGASDAGAAYLFLGPISGSVDLADADGFYYGESSSDQAGISVAGAGDVSGDGADDFLVGAVVGGGASEPGAAYLLLGDDWQ